MVVENVRGAQKWVGRAKANYGSFYLWGDVESIGGRIVRTGAVTFGMDSLRAARHKVGGFRLDGSGRSFQSAAAEGIKAPGMNWSDQTKRGQDFTRCAAVGGYRQIPEGQKNSGGSWFAINGSGVQADRNDPRSRNKPISVPGGQKTAGHLNIRDGHSHTRHLTNQAEHDGVKQSGISGVRENGKGARWFQDGAAAHGSKSNSRKAASAMIAKIPPALSRHIARIFRCDSE